MGLLSSLRSLQTVVTFLMHPLLHLYCSLHKLSACPLPPITSGPGAAGFAPWHRTHPGKQIQVLALEQEQEATASAAISPGGSPTQPSQLEGFFSVL